MTKPVILNDEQMAMLAQLRAAVTRFADHPYLRADADAIESARKLIEQAHDLNLPTTSYVELQLIVSAYETEMSLPEHLRKPSRLTGAG